MDKETGLYKGLSRNYLPVMIRDAGPDLVNSLLPIVAERLEDEGLIGRIVHE